eukprot:TRINITY_DN40734_c0_g2_i6.p1 TRINITY_DN40734_c0_g2~~TRINITY_DN40734_c0_g2_i6.p1  ORF type:complete len:446 (-),score=84.80 TRINITY_DN40734_c0_g2_i6:78-1415(-)
MMFFIFTLFGCLLVTTDSVYISACSGDSDAIELMKNRTQQATCEDIPEDVGIEWHYFYYRPFFLLALCHYPNRPCHVINSNVTDVKRGSTSSTVIFLAFNHILDPGADTDGLDSWDLLCQTNTGSGSRCPVDIVYSPSSSEVHCSVSTSTRWNITLSCMVSKAYSARSRYRCRFRNSTENQSSADTSLGVSNYSAGSISDYVHGTCTSSFVMPTSPGRYTYTVTVYPGVKQVSDVPSVSVALPSTDPTISCNTPLGFIVRHVSLVCECTASDLGQPQGRLQVYRGNTHRVSGNYGDSRVQFGESSVSSADHNAVYRCVLDWATADSEDRYSTFTLKVAHGEIVNCSSQTMEVVENTVSFHLTCKDYSPPIRWEYKSPGSAPAFLGTCQELSCSLHYLFQSAYFHLALLSNTSSRLSLKSAATAIDLQNVTYFCGGIPCRISIKLP